MSRYTNLTEAKKEKVAFGWGDLVRACWFLMGEKRKKWLVLTAVLFPLSFYSLVPPLIVGKMVDLFATNSGDGAFRPYMILALILGGSYIVVSFLRLTVKFALNTLQTEVIYKIKVNGFEKLLDFAYSWHSHENAGAKTKRIQSGVEAYKNLMHRFNNEIMRIVAKMIGTIIVFSFLEPKYIIFFVIYAVGFWIILLSFQTRIQKKYTVYYLTLENASGSYVEGLSNILTIKTLGAGNDFRDHVATREQSTKEFELSIQRLNNFLWKSFQAFNGACFGIFLFIVGLDAVQGTITAGYLVIFYGYLNDLVTTSADMMETYEKVLDSKAGVGRMMGIFWAHHKDTKGVKYFPDNWKAIEVKDATFAYTLASNSTTSEQGAPSSLGTATVKNISFSIAEGEKVGIVGRTGSGKSTIAKILTGLYRLDGGSYTVGGVPFDEISHEEQTRELTLVLQESEIFNLTLRENIALMKKLPDEVILNALRIAQLDDVVAKLPQGLDTLVGEKGYHLSGGERQRLGIARARRKNASILIFDEATSSLDSKTEYHIQEALDKELKEKTIITIAHRVSTLKNTDRIFVFDNGEIVEVGTYDELSANKKSKFYELYSTQEKSKTPA